MLFTGTIADNLQYGKPEADQDDLLRAAGTAQALEFISSMDGGLSFHCPGGINVSAATW